MGEARAHLNGSITDAYAGEEDGNDCVSIDMTPPIQTNKRSRVDAERVPNIQRSPKRSRSVPYSKRGTTHRHHLTSMGDDDNPASVSNYPDDHYSVNIRGIDSAARSFVRTESKNPTFKRGVLSEEKPGDRPRLTDVTIRATLGSAGGVLHLSPADPTLLLRETLGYTARPVDFEDITLKLLGSSGSWEISGRLCIADVHEDDKAQGLLAGSSGWQLQQRARALCNLRAMPTAAINDGARAGPPFLNSDDEDSGSECESIAHERSNRRWDPLDERRLLTWRKEGKAWKWIFDQFPTRSPGAVRTRHHMLLQKDVSGSSSSTGD